MRKRQHPTFGLYKKREEGDEGGGRRATGRMGRVVLPPSVPLSCSVFEGAVVGVKTRRRKKRTIVKTHNTITWGGEDGRRGGREENSVARR